MKKTKKKGFDRAASRKENKIVNSKSTNQINSLGVSKLKVQKASGK